MSGGAVPQIFQLEEFIVRLGPFVSEHTVVLATINWLWIALLSASVLLIATTGWLRAGIALAFAFVSAHLGMAATMRLGVFPFIMITILLLCFPTGVWNLVEAVTSKLHGSSRPTERAYRSDGGSANESASPIPSPSRVRRVIWTGAALLLVGFFLALVWWQAAGVGLVDLPASESAGELSEVRAGRSSRRTRRTPPAGTSSFGDARIGRIDRRARRAGGHVRPTAGRGGDVSTTHCGISSDSGCGTPESLGIDRWRRTSVSDRTAAWSP